MLYYLTLLALHPAVSVLAVLAVVAPVPGQAVAVRLYGLPPVTVETSHPALTAQTECCQVELLTSYLAITLVTSHPSITATLVTGLDHPGVGDCHHPHLLLEHVAGWAVDLPGLRGPARGGAVHVEPLVRAAHPVGFSLLRKSLYLVVVGGDVVHPRDHHLLDHGGAPAAVGGDQTPEGGAGLLVREVHTIQLGGGHCHLLGLGGLAIILLFICLLLRSGSGERQLHGWRDCQRLEASCLVALQDNHNHNRDNYLVSTFHFSQSSSLLSSKSSYCYFYLT